jgi:hypothetical protein
VKTEHCVFRRLHALSDVLANISILVRTSSEMSSQACGNLYKHYHVDIHVLGYIQMSAQTLCHLLICRRGHVHNCTSVSCNVFTFFETSGKHYIAEDDVFSNMWLSSKTSFSFWHCFHATLHCIWAFMCSIFIVKNKYFEQQLGECFLLMALSIHIIGYNVCLGMH